MRMCPGSMLSMNMIGMPLCLSWSKRMTRAAILSGVCFGCSILALSKEMFVLKQFAEAYKKALALSISVPHVPGGVPARNPSRRHADYTFAR